MKKIFFRIKNFISNLIEIFSFIVLIILYMLFAMFYGIHNSLTVNSPKTPETSNLFLLLKKLLDSDKNSAISKTYLIELSLRNMSSKKTRTLITMGGMSLGIGLIVFLVSIGYGVEQLIVSRVAKLEELKQTEVSPGLSVDLTLNDKSLSVFKQIPDVTDVFPVISAVGEVSLNNSSTNLAVYGVTTKYLSDSAIKPSAGRLFQSDNLVTQVNSPISTTIEENKDLSPVLIDSDSGSLPVVKIASLSSQKADQKTDLVKVGGSEKKEVVINRNTAKILNLEDSKSIGQKINISFIIINSVAGEAESKITSTNTEYQIVGIIHDDSPPLIYVPFIDLKSLGAKSFSQVKVVVEDQKNLAKVRQSVESMGYPTSSVVDTIGQIDTLFKGVRTSLGVLGLVALSVAALGMFNTLTISLLERTHEVGLMKAIGMKSTEVRNLFLSESMLMGFFGGVFGLILGFMGGKLTGLVLSMVTFTKGAGYVDVAYIPFGFALIICLLSLFIGLITGIIPAKRSMKISAIDALRYE